MAVLAVLSSEKKEPEDNIGRSVCKHFQLEKTPAVHGSQLPPKRSQLYVVLPKLLQREHDVVAAATGVSTFGLSPWRRSSRHIILTISSNEPYSFPILSRCLAQIDVLAVESVWRVAKMAETAQVSAAVQIAQCTNSSRRTLTRPFSLLVRMKYILMCHT